MENNLLDKAILFAVKAHSGMKRKKTDIPYIIHPLEALTVASTLTNDIDVLSTAVLHDTIEDTNSTIQDIKNEFNEAIANYVQFETENKRKNLPEKDTWKIRKEETLAALNNANKNEQILVLSDKLSNMRAIYRDYLEIGDNIWERFNVKDKKEQAWYYCSIAEKLTKLKSSLAYIEYCELLRKVFNNEINNYKL